MIERDSLCVGCAECISCGRRGRYISYFVCDNCLKQEDALYEDKLGEICEDCLLTAHMSDCGKCSECEEEAEILYDGKCRSCFMEDQIEIEMPEEE